MSTGKGRGRPELTDVDLSDLPGAIGHPDPEEVERRHAFATQLESPAFVARSTSTGVVKVLRPDRQPALTEQAGGSPQAPKAQNHPLPPAQPSEGRTTLTPQLRKPRAEEPNLTVRLPDYVQQAVRMKAVVERTTVRLVILRALRNAGFEIRDEDMTDDRGIVAKMRSRASKQEPAPE